MTYPARLASALAALALAAAPSSPLLGALITALPSPAAAQAGRAAEAERLRVFLDKEYADSLKFSPQQATSFGDKSGLDKLNDLSDAADLQRLQWRRASVARLKAQFQRDRLPIEG